MEFLLGTITAIALIGVGCFCYMLGKRSKTVKPKLSEEEKRKQEAMDELNAGYNKVLNYSVETAFKALRKE